MVDLNYILVFILIFIVKFNVGTMAEWLTRRPAKAVLSGAQVVC